MSYEPEEIKAGLEALLVGMRGTMSNDHAAVVREYADAGEYLLALEMIAEVIVNDGLLVFGQTCAEVARLGQLMESDSLDVFRIKDTVRASASLPGRFVFTLVLPVSSSALTNTLLFVVTDREMPWHTAARAADLIALDLRIDQWCTQVGSVSAAKHELEAVIGKTEQAATRIKSAWAAYLAAPALDIKEVQESIEEACQVFGAILTEVGGGPVQ